MKRLLTAFAVLILAQQAYGQVLHLKSRKADAMRFMPRREIDDYLKIRR